MKNTNLRLFLILFAVASLIGVNLSIYTLDLHVQVKAGTLGGASFCNINSALNCEKVAASSWAEIKGVPLAAIGLWYYGAALLFSVAAIFGLLSSAAAAAVLWPFAAFSALISIPLFLIAEFSIGTLCLMCLGMYLVNFAQAGLSYKIVRSEKPSSLNRAAATGALAVILSTIFTYAVWVAGINSVGAKMPFSQGETVAAWLKSPERTVSYADSSGVLADYYEGSAQAPVQIVEFADLQCPRCRDFYWDMKAVLEKYADKVRFSFRHYPLSSLCNSHIPNLGHEHACFAAEMVRCASEQEKTKQVLDYLMSETILESHVSERHLQAQLMSGVSKLGADLTGLGDCLSSDRQMVAIKRNIEEGEKLLIQGTPSVFINGKLVPSAQLNREGVEEIIKSLLP